jgi:dTDP-4-dehydrorhamnose reductase
MAQWLITGAGGQLGSVLLRQLSERGEEAIGVVSPSGPLPAVGRTVPVELRDEAAVARLIDQVAPQRIVHAAALTDVGRCFREPDLARRINVDATRTLVRRARLAGSGFLFVSTDMVFDGERPPYDETRAPHPQNVYGSTKLEAERTVLTEAAGDFRPAVVRVPLLYGFPAVPRRTTFLGQVQALRDGAPLRLFADELRTPLWLEDAAQAVARVATSALEGVVHAGGPESLTRVEMGRMLAQALGVSGTSIEECSRKQAADPEPRPRDLSLTSQLYGNRLGTAPGRPMREALALALALRGS